MDKKIATAVGKSLDHLLLADLTFRQAVPTLYDAAGERYDYPLVMASASKIVERCKPGDRVMILTGWPSRSWLFSDLTETDGPVGAVVMARILEEALGCVPIIGCLESLKPHLGACLRGAGLIWGTTDQALRSKPGPPSAAVGAVVGIPQTVSETQKLLNDVNPSAIIAIEIPGPGVDGNFHTVSGRQIPIDEVPRADLIFLEGKRRGVLTVGIGDGGNELGMGALRERALDAIPYGDRVLSTIDADAVVVASNSNWGAQGLAAAILALANRVDVFARVDVQRIVNISSDLGAIDGLSARVDRAVDGTPAAMSQHLWNMMELGVKSAIEGWLKG